MVHIFVFSAVNTYTAKNKNIKEFRCERVSNSYFKFATVRDKGATLKQAERSIEKLYEEEKDKLNTMGVNALEILNETKETLGYVYRNKGKSATQLKREAFNRCMGSN